MDIADYNVGDRVIFVGASVEDYGDKGTIETISSNGRIWIRWDSDFMLEYVDDVNLIRLENAPIETFPNYFRGMWNITNWPQSPIQTKKVSEPVDDLTEKLAIAFLSNLGYNISK